VVLDQARLMCGLVVESAAKNFTRESLSINCHPDIARSQCLVDLAHYADTMSACRDRVHRLLKVFEERVEAKRQELPLLLAIRRKYALVDVRDDRYLGKMETADGERAYVIVLNPKAKRDQPDPEQALMRRVILQVRDKTEPTLILHFHPKLRDQPLRYMAVTLEVSGAVNAIEVYVFDTHTDVPIVQDERATERFNEIDYQLKSKLRSLLLYDMLSKLRQEEGFETSIEEHSITGTLRLEKMFKVSIKFTFASQAEDLKEVASESRERLISHKLMLKLILNVAESTTEANILRCMFYMVAKRYMSYLVSTTLQRCQPKLVPYTHYMRSTYEPYK
jgi:hypothetical protein